jgi:mannose-6-phosphate isomerase-like protein (cupin superfamily)
MKGYITNIEKETIDNTDYRRVLYTAKNSQLVLMNLQPGEEIGEELHTLDQFIRFEQGEATVVLNKEETYSVSADYAIVIPAGVWHNIINSGNKELKLYTVYSPPEHRDGVVQKNKASEIEEHFDGKTTEQ